MSENLNVKIKKGTFYLSSKEDKGEGWERQEFKNPQNKDETLVRYHKEVSLKGTIKSLSMEDDKYAGKVCKVGIESGETMYWLTVPIMDTGGSVKTTNQYFNSLVGPLMQLSKGDEVNMFVNNKNEDKNGNLYRNIVTLKPDNTLIKAPFKFTDAPKWKSKEVEDEFGEAKKEWDATETNKFYIDKFKEALKNFGITRAETPADPIPSKEAVAGKKKAKVAVEEEDNSLPF